MSASSSSASASSISRSYHCRLSANGMHQQAAHAIVIADAIRRYGPNAGRIYCAKNGIHAPARLIVLARQLNAAHRAGF